MFEVLHPALFWTAVVAGVVAVQIVGALVASAFFRNAAGREVTITA